MTADELVEKVAADAWQRRREESIKENDDDLGPWFTPNPEWEDLPWQEHEGHYLRLPILVDARAAVSLVVRECVKVARQFPATYEDGVSLHAENMTTARIGNALSTLDPEANNG